MREKENGRVGRVRSFWRFFHVVYASRLFSLKSEFRAEKTEQRVVKRIVKHRCTSNVRDSRKHVCSESAGVWRHLLRICAE